MQTVVGVREAERAPIAALFRDRYPAMVRLAWLLTSDRAAAEEIAQEAFIRTWRAWDRIEREGAESAYVRAAVVNLARSSLRRRLLEMRHRAAGEPERPSEPDAAGRLDLARAVRGLPPRQRACVVLRYYEDLTEQETARLLGVSAGTVKSQVHKALRTLERRLGEPGR